MGCIIIPFISYWDVTYWLYAFRRNIGEAYLLLISTLKMTYDKFYTENHMLLNNDEPNLSVSQGEKMTHDAIAS